MTSQASETRASPAEYALLRNGQFEQAIASAETRLQHTPEDLEALILASEAHLALDKPTQALEFNARAIAIAPAPLPLLIKQATLQMRMRRRSDAIATVERALEFAAGSPQALAALARIMTGCNDSAAACRLHQRVLDSNPPAAQRPAALFNLAAAQFFTGALDDAERHLDTLLALNPQAGHAAWLRASLRRQTRHANHIDALRAMLAQTFANQPEHAATAYALAKELEDLGEHGEAFATLQSAATLKRKTLNYDVRGECNAISTMRDALGRRAEQEGHAEPGAIFIVGLPRTGTTLIESLLVRHGAARSAGELLDLGLLIAAQVQVLRNADAALDHSAALAQMDLTKLGRDYMLGARDAAHGAPTFIDKMPVNYMYCGAIAQALPQARIVHVTRHPMDACYAIYKTLFHQAYHFSYRLDELADYYIAYHQTMQHWHARYPGSILDVSYEAMVTSPDSQCRRLVDWCGLEWNPGGEASSSDPVTTASAAQVREPIHTRSIDAWKRHAAELTPLRERLMAAGIPID